MYNQVSSALLEAEKQLASSGVTNARMESLWLLSHQLGVNAGSLLSKNVESIGGRELKGFRKKVLMRARRIPLAYLLGSQDFMGLEFFVNHSVLIPRPETEIVVAEVLGRVSGLNRARILDVGTGSGNIAVVLAKKMASAKILATDISSRAIAVAQANARVHGVDKNITFIRHDLFPKDDMNVFDAVVSNPPYVREDERHELQEEIHFEPMRALFGGKDGLKVIRRLVGSSRDVLKDHGLLFLEIGHGQSGKVKKMMESAGFSKVEAVKDPSGTDRVIIGSIHG